MRQLFLPHGMTLVFFDDRDVGTVSDGHHTFNELDRHRHLLFCLALLHDQSAWKSRVHHDGTMHDGWFIAGTSLLCAYDTTDTGTPCAPYSLLQAITYHLPVALWDLCKVRELPCAPPGDGHTSLDVCERLERALNNPPYTTAHATKEA